MTSRADKAAKSQKDKHHTILRELVQEPSNKTCAECLAKGPRWSSWSLGVFVCIRCAGIHRNLGVHISKMKSIDLDSWTAEQLQNVLRWGNKRAAEYFECYLPKDFTRPQATHALESFIRNKYEKKLYIKKDGEPPENGQSKVDRLKNDQKEEKEKEKKPVSNTARQRRAEKKPEAPKQSTTNSNNTILDMASKTETNKLSPAAAKVADQQHNKSHSMSDLLSLDNPTPVAQEVKHSASSNDLLNFGGWSDPLPAASGAQNNSDPFFLSSGTATRPSNDLFANQAPTATTESNPAVSSASVKSTKESILSLYGNGASTSMPQQQQQPQMFGVPGGVYTMNNMNPYQQQQARQQQQPSAYQQQQPNTVLQQQQGGMNQMNQMNYQMQRMSFNQQQQQPQTHQQPFMNQQQHNFNAYKQPQQQQQMMYRTQQQQQRPMINTQQMNSYPQIQQQNHQQQNQQNFNMMGQQNMGNNMGWGQNFGQQQQQPQQQPQQQQQQQQMFNGMNNGFGGATSNSGNTMNNLLWN